MARPTDWSALDLPGDPVPGDTAAIRADARALKQVAALITEQAQRLKAIAAKGEDAWESDAGKAFVRNSSDLAGEVEKAKGRYEQTGAALATYADDLDVVQAEADQLLRKAQDAKADQHSAQNMALPAKSDPSFHSASQAQQTRIDAANTALRSTQDGLSNVLADWARINQKAASAINSASDDGLKDHWWEGGVFGALTDAFHWISNLDNLKKVLGWVGLGLAVLAIVAAIWFPGTWLLAGALIAGFLVAGTNFGITATQYAQGDEDVTKGDLIWAAVDVALSGFGAAAGVKILGAAAQAASEAVGGGLVASMAKGGAFWQKLAGFAPIKGINELSETLERPMVTAASRLRSSIALTEGNLLRRAGESASDGLRGGWAQVLSRTNGVAGRIVKAADENMTGGGATLLLTRSAGQTGRAVPIVRGALFGTLSDGILTVSNTGKAALDGVTKVHSLIEQLSHEPSGGGPGSTPSSTLAVGAW